MNCPGCAAAMDRLALDATLGTTVEIDVCRGCHAFWFDEYETLKLAPRATLALFSLIAEASRTASPPLPASVRCGRCRGVLRLSRDRQGNTPFQYLRCPAGHGRFMRFSDFLKEKRFVQAVTPQQLRELRTQVRTTNCTNCAAPVDLMQDSSCRHCGSALVVLDRDAMERVAQQYQRAASRPVPQVPPALMRDSPGSTLLDFDLESVASWLLKFFAR
jgi:Zn-finger nucleic acid-binding protein